MGATNGPQLGFILKAIGLTDESNQGRIQRNVYFRKTSPRVDRREQDWRRFIRGHQGCSEEAWYGQNWGSDWGWERKRNRDSGAR